MYHVIWGDVFSWNHADLYSADVYTCIHIIMVVIQNHILVVSFWLIVNVCSFTSLVRTPIPPLLRRWGWCSWDAHGVGVQRRHLEAMRHLETISLFGGDTETRHVFFSVGVGGVLLLGRWITDMTVDTYIYVYIGICMYMLVNLFRWFTLDIRWCSWIPSLVKHDLKRRVAFLHSGWRIGWLEGQVFFWSRCLFATFWRYFWILMARYSDATVVAS